MNNDMFNKSTLWNAVEKIRNTAPLIHNITNYVVMNNTANALLAIGASPVMAHAKEEVEDMVAIANALVVNIGTLSPVWIEAMELAMNKAKELNKPIVLDPVGAGATSYRNEVLEELCKTVRPSIIRGNASEIIALVEKVNTTKGVDSTEASSSAIAAAKYLSFNHQCTVSISGEKDIIIHNDSVIQIANGHPLMAKVTGMGCIATAITGAFASVQSPSLVACVNAMATMGVAGEIAAQKAEGPGSFQMHFLDAIYNLSENDFDHLKIDVKE